MKAPLISIVICTYSRSVLLEHCLNALLKLQGDHNDFEVVIIDNNSKDDTADRARQYADRFPHFRYILETTQGLSHARNRAIQEVNTDWLVYLDDDAKVTPDFTEVIIKTIQTDAPAFFGGTYLPWYLYGKPHWFRDRYASNAKKYTVNTVLPASDFVAGCVMIIHKPLFEEIGPFLTDIGMNADKIAYGEETELQNRARKAGKDILFVPDLKIEHLVARYQLDIDWFFKSAFALGRDNITTKNYSTAPLNLLLIALTAVLQTLWHLIRYTPRLWFNNAYYIENWLIDVFKKPAKRVGTVYSGLKTEAAKRVENKS